jgi:NAD(P)-dependent dehydrogenase (short-subunit alcohol dehydrogenase family)
MSDRRLDGRVAIVTGASRGLGAALSAAFAAEGAAVALAARTQEPERDLPGTVHEAAAATRRSGGRAIAVPCDVAVDDDLVRLVDVATNELGPVDVLVNNAAATIPGRPGRRATPPARSTSEVTPLVIAVPLKAIRTQFEVNLFAAWRLMQLVLPGMLKRGRGAILNIGSEAARMPAEGPYEAGGAPVLAAYGVSKLALEHLTRCVAHDVAGTGIAVNALAPSLPIPTPGLEWAGGGSGLIATSDSFAEAALRLLSADPATTSGQVWHSEDLLHPELGRRGWLGA